MTIMSDLSSKFNDAVGGAMDMWKTVGSANPFGATAPQLRYPLGNAQTHKNLIKFEAIGRVRKGGELDITQGKLALLPLGSVTMYMPSGLNTSDSLTYENKDSGILGEGLNTLAQGATTGDMGSAMIGAGKGVIQSIGAGAAGQMQNLNIKGVPLGGAGVQAQINLGMVNNPHTQMLFKAPGLRSFSFNFKMIPKDAAEAVEIIKIIKFFRTFAYPALGDNNTGDGSINMSAYKFPEIFRITYITIGVGENRNISRIMDSYCTSIATTYNATSPTFHANGMPSEIDLALSFQESKAVNIDLIVKDGY